MKHPLARYVSELKKVIDYFDEEHHQMKLIMLNKISSCKLVKGEVLITYFESLLFLCSYPPNEELLKLSEKELQRISSFLKHSGKIPEKIFNNSGLPYTITSTRFSHDFLHWLCANSSIKTTLKGFIDPTLQLNDVLRFTLPSLETAETTAGLNNEELFESLLLKKNQRLSFLLSEFGRLDELPSIKDYLFESLDLHVNIHPLNPLFSKSNNRVHVNKVFFHSELKKKFDHEILFEQKLPIQKPLNSLKRNQVIKVVKSAMALTARETDPSTYMDENSLRFFELERGVSVAIYGITAPRQLPLESYVGFTLFKNGFPASYGGSWVFGEHAHFGINVFESFRGGESGYLMCQLIRLYHQVFKVNHFEVEPYQFGLDNPEGIASGAFWFYYRFGFRPMDKSLFELAKKERIKINKTKGYRSSKTILKQFTRSNIILKLKNADSHKVADISLKVKKMISTNYNGNRLIAEKECVSAFLFKSKLKKKFNKDEMQVLKEVALWSAAYQINAKNKIDHFSQMVSAKPTDLYKYQELLLQFFNRK